MKRFGLLMLGVGAVVALAGEPPDRLTSPVKSNLSPAPFALIPIGYVRQETGRTIIRLEPAFRDGLLGLEAWSHVWLFYWFDRNDTPPRRAVLRVHPRGDRDNPLTGVFATRAPVRPNLIALSLCRVLAVRESEIEIEGTDAFEGTPVLDLKPYIGEIDTPAGDRRHPSWMDRKSGPPGAEP